MLTITELGGTLNISDNAKPNHTDTIASTVDTAIASPGRAVSMIAVAAGVTTSANSSRVPTDCTAMVTARPSSAMKTTESRPTGTHLAPASSRLTDANNSGRYPNQTTRASTVSTTFN